MKKIMLILSLVFMLFAASAVHAVTYGDQLEFYNVKVYIDGKSKSPSNGANVKTAYPESEIKFKIQLENRYSDNDQSIEDIEVRVLIEQIDDEDDLDEDLEFDDLDDGGDKSTEEFEFDIPLQVDTDKYKVYLTATGDDWNNSNLIHRATFNFTLEVKKESHDIKIYKKTVNPSTVECGGSTELQVGVINIGDNDEDIDLTVSNTRLGFTQTSSFEVQEGGFDDNDVKDTKRYTVTIPSTTKAGSYPIAVRAKFDDAEDMKEESIPLTVSCGATTTTTTTPATTTTTTTPTTTTTDRTTTTTPPPAPISNIAQPPIIVKQGEKTFMAQYGVALVILLYIAVFAAGALTYMHFFVKKKK